MKIFGILIGEQGTRAVTRASGRDLRVRSAQRGISMVEAILGVATLGVGLGIIADMQVENLRKVKADGAAQQMQVVFGAAKSAVRDYYSDIINGCAAGTCASVAVPATAAGNTNVIPIELLSENNYLDPRMVTGGGAAITPNSYDQTYVISVTNIGPPPAGGGDRLRVQVVTQGGNPISDQNGAQIAAAIGTEGGFRPIDDANGGSPLYADDTMFGAYGNWQMTQAQMGGAATSPTDGGLAAVAYFGEGGVVGDFLYRNPVPGQPEAQQMNANIDSNAFGIGNLKQIGGEDVGGGVDSNPDLVNTGTAPAIIPNVFNPGARVDTDGDGLLEDNIGGAATGDNTIRFGNDNQTGANGSYARGNANIIANDAIFGIVDAEEALRAQTQVVAVDRAVTNGQRAVVDSGLDVNGADRATAGAGAASSDTGFKFYDAGNAERGIFTYEAGGDGRVSMGTDTTQIASRRVDLYYGRDRNNNLANTQGSLVTRDDTGVVRSNNSYGSSADGTASATAGDMQLYDNANNQRVRADYGQLASGAPNAAAGNVLLYDNNGVPQMRVRADYGQLEGGAATANAGNMGLYDTGGNGRFQADYGQNAAGGAAATPAGRLQLRDGARGRVTAYYGIDAAGATVANAGALLLNDNGGNERHRAAYSGITGEALMTDNGGNIRVLQRYTDANTGQSTISDGAARARFDNSYTNAQTLEVVRDQGNNIRKQFDTAAGNGRFTLHGTNGTERIRMDSTNGATTFANTNSSNLAASGGYVQVNPNDGALEIGSGNDAISYLDFKGNGTLANDYRGRIQYDDGANNGFTLRTAGSANGEMYLRDGLLSVAGGGGEGGQIILSPNDTLQTTETASTWSMDVMNNRFRLFRGTSGASDMIALVGGTTGRVGMGSGDYFSINNPGARLDIYCSTADDPTNCLRVRNNAGNRAVLINPNGAGGDGVLKIGTDGVVGNSPLGANRGVVDVDDIYLRGKDVWLSDVTRIVLAGVDVVTHGGSVPAAITQRCTNGSGAGGMGGNAVYVATPAWWLSPTMMSAMQLVTTSGGLVQSSATVNPQSGVQLGNAAPNAYDNNTEVQVFMTGSTLTMRSRQRNHTTWRNINGGVSVVTVYCQL